MGGEEAGVDPVRRAGGWRIQRRQQEETFHGDLPDRSASCYIPGTESKQTQERLCFNLINLFFYYISLSTDRMSPQLGWTQRPKDFCGTAS